MKMRLEILITAIAVLCGLADSALGTQTWLAFRSETGTCVYNGVATQTLEAQFGTNVTTLPFPGTTTYDFYSPPLAQPVNLFPSDKVGGVIYMQNTATTSANDFSVSGRMQFFDYDPATGNQVLIGDTTASPAKNVNHGQTVNWAIPNQLLPSNMTIAAGHLIHITTTIGLVSGNPATFGRLVYNGPAGPSTSGLLPQNRSQVLNWPFAALSQGPDATVTPSAWSVAAGSTGNTASVPSSPGATYEWSILNGTITAGQGTAAIVWSAGSSGPVILTVVVASGCASIGSASIGIPGMASGPTPPTLSITQQPDETVSLICAGTAMASYLVQATTSLTSPNWTTLVTTNAGVAGIFEFIDVDATNFPCRFYRAQAQ